MQRVHGTQAAQPFPVCAVEGPDARKPPPLCFHTGHARVKLQPRLSLSEATGSYVSEAATQDRVHSTLLSRTRGLNLGTELGRAASDTSRPAQRFTCDARPLSATMHTKVPSPPAQLLPLGRQSVDGSTFPPACDQNIPRPCHSGPYMVVYTLATWGNDPHPLLDDMSELHIPHP